MSYEQTIHITPTEKNLDKVADEIIAALNAGGISGVKMIQYDGMPWQQPPAYRDLRGPSLDMKVKAENGGCIVDIKAVGNDIARLKALGDNAYNAIAKYDAELRRN
jgi:hypothetical protein